MSRRRLVAVPDVDVLIDAGLRAVFNEKLAEDVVAGRVIHNLETDHICMAEVATDEFRADAAAAYCRFLAEREAEAQR